MMAVAAERVRREVGLPVGINVLANAALHALAIARAAGAVFVRVNQWANAYVANEGLIEGPAAPALRYRESLRGGRGADLRRQPRQAWQPRDHRRPVVGRAHPRPRMSRADVVIATGQRTGDAAARPRRPRSVRPRRPAAARRLRRDARPTSRAVLRHSTASSSPAPSRSTASGGTRSTRARPRVHRGRAPACDEISRGTTSMRHGRLSVLVAATPPSTASSRSSGCRRPARRCWRGSHLAPARRQGPQPGRHGRARRSERSASSPASATIPRRTEIGRHLEPGSRRQRVLVRGAGASGQVGDHGGPPTARTRSSAPAGQAQSLTPEPVDRVRKASLPGGVLLLQGNLLGRRHRAMPSSRAGATGCVAIANAAPVAFAWQDLQPEIDVLVVNAVEAGLIGPMSASTVIVTEGASGATLIQGRQRATWPRRPWTPSTPLVPATCFAVYWPRPWTDRCRCWRRWSVRYGRRRSR